MAAVFDTINKIRVVSTFGQSAPLGSMDPKVGMPTNLGYIGQVQTIAPGGSGYWTPSTGINGSGLVEIGSGQWRDPTYTKTANVSGHYFAYANTLMITSGAAVGFGWPTGADCVSFGHSGQAPLYKTDFTKNIWFLNAGLTPSGVPR